MKASECKCINCGKQAVAYWPVIDPDIPSYPYCRACLDKEKSELLFKLFGDDVKMEDVKRFIGNETNKEIENGED